MPGKMGGAHELSGGLAPLLQDLGSVANSSIFHSSQAMADTGSSTGMASAGSPNEPSPIASPAAGWAGSSSRATTAPAALTPATTRQAILKPSKNDVDTAEWTASASAGWPLRRVILARLSAPPTDSWAARASRGASSVGSFAVSRLLYMEAKTLPTTATPRVAPSSRVASLTAEPMPALAFGTTPMIASVAGALTSPTPLPPRI